MRLLRTCINYHLYVQSGLHFAICFSQDLKRYGATTVVRVCDITYDKAPLEKDGINVVVRAPENTHQSHLPYNMLALEVFCFNFSRIGHLMMEPLLPVSWLMIG